jgi:hypothetical protein
MIDEPGAGVYIIGIVWGGRTGEFSWISCAAGGGVERDYREDAVQENDIIDRTGLFAGQCMRASRTRAHRCRIGFSSVVDSCFKTKSSIHLELSALSPPSVFSSAVARLHHHLPVRRLPQRTNGRQPTDRWRGRPSLACK